jgi:hypothetical protein
MPKYLVQISETTYRDFYVEAESVIAANAEARTRLARGDKGDSVHTHEDIAHTERLDIDDYRGSVAYELRERGYVDLADEVAAWNDEDVLNYINGMQHFGPEQVAARFIKENPDQVPEGE